MGEIQPEVIKIMQDVQLRRVEKEFRTLQTSRRKIFKELYDQYLASQPLHAIIPECAYIALVPTVKAIVNYPADKTVTAHDFDLPKELARWRNFEDEKLVDLIREFVPKATKADLDRPTSIFRCLHCNENLHYPRVLVHACRRARGSDDDSPIFEDLGQPWARWFTFHNRGHQNAITLLRACGWDIDRVTLQDIKIPDLYFECATCSNVNEGRAFLTWDTAVSFFLYARRDLLKENSR